MNETRKKSAPRPIHAGRRLVGKGVRAGLRDGKTLALYRAARGLLSEKDFEEISVARIAEAGGCSVGAFYGRFSDKKVFLEFLIGETFRQATSRAENALADDIAGGISFGKTAREIAGAIAGQFGEEECAGVIRAAVKLGFSDPKSRAPFDDYREAVAERAIALLAPHLPRGSEGRVRQAMQAAFGISTDAVVTGRGLLRPGSAAMTEALFAVIAHLSAGGKSAASKIGNPPKNKIDEKFESAPLRTGGAKPRARKIRMM